VRGRGAATSAQNAYTGGSRFTRKEAKYSGEIWIDDASPSALGQTGIRHAADAEVVDCGELLQDREQGLRADGAIGGRRPEHFIFELGGSIARLRSPVGNAFIGIGELSDDGKPEKERMASMAKEFPRCR